MARLVVVHVHDAATIEDREERTEDHEAAARRRVERRDDLLDVVRDDHRDALARVRDVRRYPFMGILVHHVDHDLRRRDTEGLRHKIAYGRPQSYHLCELDLQNGEHGNPGRVHALECLVEDVRVRRRE